MINWPWNRKNDIDLNPVLSIPFHARLSSATGEEPAAIDTYSGTWIFIRGFLQNSLQDLREANDSVNKDDLQTAVLRGQIKMAKKILELPNPKPTFPAEQDADSDETEF